MHKTSVREAIKQLLLTLVFCLLTFAHVCDKADPEQLTEWPTKLV